jgi:sirohydrochlorin ferrochelatase
MPSNQVASLLYLLLLIKLALSSSFILGTSNPFRLPSYTHSSDSDNLFDYFDPLLSPHAYPNGIQSGEKPREVSPKREIKPLEMEPSIKSSATTSRPTVDSDPNTFFDPTISPHNYASGAPDRIVGYERHLSKRVGILLIDHGSRRPDANQRLFELARLYQQSLNDSDNTIVTAAHMEIATPSIKDGIASLLDSGVDEIICHPYFLSPGRHVQEDIPHLVKEATESLNVTIPIVTTEPIGSNTDLMIQAIDGMVRRASPSMDKLR